MKVPGARRIRVGIIGANPDRGWAALAHIPALKSTLRGGKGAQASLEILPVLEQYRWSSPQGPGPSTNVAQAYARFARYYLPRHWDF